MTMADNSIRKACDRCHSQKLSCRRVGEEPCVRCTRLKTECKFSPSLRYKKQSRQQKQQQQHQQHQQQQHQQHQQHQQQPHQTQIHQHQHQHQPQQQQQQQHPPDHQLQHQPQPQQILGHQQPPPPPQPQHHHHFHHQHYQQVPHQDALGAETVPVTGSRSPKRRRTSSDPSLVLLEAVPAVSGTEGLTGEPHSVVTSETAPDLSDFNFTFDQLGFFAPAHSDHLSHPTILSESLHAHPVQQAGLFIEPWDHRLPANPDSFPVIDHTQPQPQQPLSRPQPELHHSPRIPSYSSASSVVYRGRDCLSEQSAGPNSNNGTSGTKRPRFRTRQRSRQRSRQIALRDTATPGQLQKSSSSRMTSWVARMDQLTEINKRLLELSSALPQAQEAAQGPLGRPTDERFKADGFPIDEMFKLTGGVADIFDKLVATTVDGDSAAAQQARRHSKDPANSMFVLTTYVRLLDMYEKVFSLVQTELAETDSEAAFEFWKLPDVTIGSIAVDSVPSLQIQLMIQLTEEFLCRLRNATAALNSSLRSGEDSATNGQAGGGGGGSPSSSSASGFSGVADVSYQAVKSSEERLGKRLAELRAEVESMLDD